MRSRDLRMLAFLFGGTIVGGGLGLGLGFAFRTSSMKEELIVYTAVGLIAGFFFGLVGHMVTYRADKNIDPGTKTPAMGSGFGGINSGMGGGVVMMVIAVLWFGGGFFLANRIFFAPPVIFVIGLCAFVKGLFASK